MKAFTPPPVLVRGAARSPTAFQVPVRDRVGSLWQSMVEEFQFSKVDVGWLQNVFEYLSKKQQHVPYRAGIDNVLDVQLPSKAKVGIVGDWGTGTPEAIKVMNQVKNHDPDLLIHLGDVYYSGTFKEYNERFFKPLANTVPGVVTLSLCGNHDCYSGGEAYYAAVDRLGQKASYFCVRNDHWQLIAMDTGRSDFDPLTKPFIVPCIDESEAAWVRAKMDSAGGRKTILMSHHQPFSAFESCGAAGDTNVRLLDQVGTGYLDGIDMWIFGHEHKLVVYDSYLGVKRGRCVGGSAVPVFVSDGRADKKHPNVPSIAISVGDDGYVMNRSFAILELDGPDCTATYWQDSDTVNPVYRETF